MTAVQLELPFIEEDLYLRSLRLEEKRKADDARTRKAVFAKIGKQDGRLAEVEYKLNIIIEGLCKQKTEFNF